MKHAFLCLVAIGSLMVSSLVIPSYAADDTCPAVDLESLDDETELVTNNTNLKDPTFILVGFDPDYQETLEVTMAKADKLKEVFPNLTIAEIPVIDSKYRSFAGLINRFMKDNVKNKSNFKRIYPLYTDMSDFRNTLGVGKDEPYTFLLCDRNATILWQQNTPPSASELGSLKNKLNTNNVAEEI